MHLSAAIPWGWPRRTPGHLHQDICKFHLSRANILPQKASTVPPPMLGKDDQQKGTDLREKRKTRLPFPPSPFWKPFNGNTQSPRSGSFIFKIAAMLQIPRVFPRVSCLEVQKRSNAPVPGQKLATKVSKSRAILQYVPGVNPPPPVWPLISA